MGIYQLESQKFDGQAIEDMIQEMSDASVQMSAYLDAIHQADAAQDAYWRLLFRYYYVSTATFHDDPPKAIPIAAEFGPIFENHPEAIRGNLDWQIYMLITEFAIDPMVFLPQIPISQWNTIMQQYLSLANKYGMGKRTYWAQMARFYAYIDLNKAFEYLKKSRKEERDDLSDCEECETIEVINFCIQLGDKETAEKFAKRIAWDKKGCEGGRERYDLIHLEDALNRGAVQEALPWANALYAKINPQEDRFLTAVLAGNSNNKDRHKERNDLSKLGAIMRCWSYTNLKDAVTILEESLEWCLTMWDKKKQYDFYKAAWCCCVMLEKQGSTASLNLPQKFELWQESGSYNVVKLKNWFRTQTEKIGKVFDTRNHSDFFAKDLEVMCRCLEC